MCVCVYINSKNAKLYNFHGKLLFEFTARTYINSPEETGLTPLSKNEHCRTEHTSTFQAPGKALE